MPEFSKTRTDLLRRHGQLRAERSSWMAHWQEISNYLLPRAGRYFRQDRNLGGRRHNQIYDSTATRALKTLAAGMMAGMTSPARPWFRMGIPDEDLAKSQDVKVWLADVTKIMLRVFEKSNTYRALHSIYTELGAFSTAASVVSSNFNTVIHHHPLTVGEYAIATDYSSQVVTLYREFEKTVAEIVAEFGYDNCSTAVQGMYTSGNLHAWVPLVQAIEPRSDRDRDHRKRDKRNMPWANYVFELGGNGDRPLYEGGMKTFRCLAPRWEVIGGDVYGSGPGQEALGDIKQLQHEQLRKSQAIDYMSNPPLQVPTSLKNRDIERLPGGITYVDAASPSGAIRSMFDVRLDLNHLREDIVDVRQRINGAFYADLFLMLANSTNTSMTATEVAERHEEKLLMLGPVLERLHNELLSPLIDIAFSDLLEAGALPPPPDDLQGQELTVEFSSMLAQAQKAIGTNGIDRFAMSLGTIAQAKPDVLDKFDADTWADVYSDLLSVDPRLIVGAERVALIRQQRAQAAAQQQQMAMAQAGAQTARDMAATPVGGDNVLTNVVDMFSGYTS